MTRLFPWVALGLLLGTAGSLAQAFDGRSYCRPPLKLAAGACVASCPAGFEDRGSFCEFRRGGGGGGGP